jgi:hypothetical protein
MNSDNQVIDVADQHEKFSKELQGLEADSVCSVETEEIPDVFQVW